MAHDPTSSPGASSHRLLKGAALMGILLLAAAIVFWATPLLEKRRAQKIVDRHFTWSQSDMSALIKPLEERGQELVALDAETVWALSVIGTRSLDLSYCDELRNLAALKSLHTLVSLDLIGCTGLTSVDALPAGLQTLDIIGCTGLTGVDALPAGLQTLQLIGCTGLTTLDALPAGLQALDLDVCTGLTAVDALPAGLQTLDLIGCTGLTAVGALPAGLKKLNLSDCTGLTGVDALPAGLQTLYLIGCTGLAAVDALPAGLQKLYLNECTGLERVGALPAGLAMVEMRDTPKLPEAVKVEIRAMVKKNGGKVVE